MTARRRIACHRGGSMTAWRRMAVLLVMGGLVVGSALINVVLASSALARQSSHSSFSSFSVMVDISWDDKFVSFHSVKITSVRPEVITALFRAV